MRTILISLKPNVFDNVASGKKIYEYRKVFPNEPIKAYIYISKPIQSITGFMILNNKISLETWRDQFKNDQEAIKRIDDYMTKNRFAMQIHQFQNTNTIPLAKLKEFDPKFLIPQMYYYLDNTKLLKHLEKKLIPQGEPIKHEFSTLTSDMVCCY